jgi:uncharacterized protein (TIGR03000 family)
MLHLSMRRWPLLLGLAVCVFTFPPVRGDEAVPADKAVLVVRLPADAKLVVEGQTTKQTGAERTFESPTLDPQKKYVYTLKATWEEGGKKHEVTRKVSVKPGQRVTVDFNKEETSEQTKPEAKGKPAVDAKPKTEASQPKTRTFLFTYSATVTGLPAGKTARVWLPVPPSNTEQEVEIVSKNVPPGGKIAKEDKHGNEILSVEAKADKDGQLPLELTYRVTRKEVLGGHKGKKIDPDQVAMYLEPNAKVPVGGKSLELIKDKKLPSDQLETARVLYEVVNGHMRYSKEGTSWGQGDSDWACTSGYGNCTDFHSLFMSLARAQNIPAKFEIGFPLPVKRGAGEIPGYHCWAYFRPSGHGWIPVDISEANKNPNLKDYYFGNLSEDRVTFSTGRDLELVPKQAGKPLNFFIYPYVEVDGKPYDKVQKKFSFKDEPAEHK